MPLGMVPFLHSSFFAVVVDAESRSGDQEFPLHPPFLAPVLVGCLIAATIQWILVLYFGTRSRALGSLDSHPMVTALRGNQPSSTLRAVPFVRDSFFILWNLLPFAFGIPYLFLYYHDWGDIHKGLSLHFTNVEVFYNRWIHSVLFSPLLLVGILVIAFVSAMLQITKQRSYIQHGTHVYWWDWRISKPLYLTRLVFLIINMAGILFSAFMLGVLFGFILDLVSHGTPNSPMFASLVDADQMGGFAFLFDFTTGMAVVLLFISGMSLTGVFDHWDTEGIAGNIHRFSDLTSFFVSLGAALMLLIVPSSEVNKKIDSEFGWLREPVAERIRAAQTELFSVKKGEVRKPIDVQKWLNQRSSEMTALHQISRLLAHPARPERAGMLFTTFILPLVVWLFFRFLNTTALVSKTRQ